MAGATGLEPATPRSTVWYSNQIELRPRTDTMPVWGRTRVEESAVPRTAAELPGHLTMGGAGFEPTTSCL